VLQLPLPSQVSPLLLLLRYQLQLLLPGLPQSVLLTPVHSLLPELVLLQSHQLPLLPWSLQQLRQAHRRASQLYLPPALQCLQQCPWWPLQQLLLPLLQRLPLLVSLLSLQPLHLQPYQQLPVCLQRSHLLPVHRQCCRLLP